MDCSEYLERCSEYLDDQIDEEIAGEFKAHLSDCSRCRQYHATLLQGRDLLRAIPSLEVPPDFHARLDHRILHIEDGASIARESLGSGATTAAVVAMTVLLALAAWAPLVGSSRVSLELPAVVVAQPPSPTFTPRARHPSFSRGGSFFTTVDFQEGVWGDTHELLFEYSSLSHRRRGSYLSRVGLQ